MLFTKILASILGWVAAVTIFLMCLLTVVEVSLRHLPVKAFLLGAVEISQLLNVIACFSILGLVFFYGQHIVVSVVHSRLPKRIQNVSSKVNLLIGCILWGIVTWKMGGEAIWSVQVMEVQFGVANAPVWPARVIAVLGTAVLFLALVFTLISKFRGNHEKEDHL
jgi:TRAP-type C4-dicarboxylate transport system permease small subunit